MGVFAYLIGNWNSLARIVFESFAGLGLKSSGTSLSASDFLRPGKIAQVGLDAGRPLLDSISRAPGFPQGGAYNVFVPGLLIQLGLFGATGVGFGLGVSVVIDPEATETPSSRGTFGWSGVATTTFWVDPARDLTVQFMTQVRPPSSNAVFPELRRMVHEAVVG